MKTAEAELITHAVTEMRKQGVPVTPARVERAVNAARPTVVSVDEAVAAVNRLVEKSKEADPNQGREVVAVCLTPTAPDGSGGEIKKVIRVGPKPQQEYAEMRNDPPMAAAPDDLARATKRLKELNDLIDNPETDVASRTSAVIERDQLLEVVSSTAAALRQHHRVGAAPTAGQAQHFAAPTPYFRLSDAKRTELEAEASALRGKIAKVGLRPEVKDKLKQDLAKIEDLLRMDASPVADPRTFAERRMQS